MGDNRYSLCYNQIVGIICGVEGNMRNLLFYSITIFQRNLEISQTNTYICSVIQDKYYSFMNQYLKNQSAFAVAGPPKR